MQNKFVNKIERIVCGLRELEDTRTLEPIFVCSLIVKYFDQTEEELFGGKGWADAKDVEPFAMELLKELVPLINGDKFDEVIALLNKHEFVNAELIPEAPEPKKQKPHLSLVKQ